MRHGAQRRFTPPGRASRVDEFPEALSDLEEWDPLFGNVDGAAGLRIASLARIPVANTEAAEATKLDLVALGQRVSDVVEDRVDDGLGLFFRQVGELGDLVDQLGFCHLALRVMTLARRFRECQT